MPKPRKFFIFLLIIALLGSFLYYRDNKEMHKKGLDKLEMDAIGYDGTNPFTVLSTQLITPHYNIHTNLDYERLDYFEKFFEGFFEYFDREVFKIKQPKRLEVFLFDDLKYYEPFARHLAGANPFFTPYGFYLTGRNIIVVNADSGLGTTTHELTHHFIYCGFDERPADWIHEGIASFFEKFIGHLDETGRLHITVGYFSNVRLPLTKEFLNEYSLPSLIALRGPPQPPVRSFIMFLHKKGMFKQFARIAANSKDDPYGLGALETVYGKPVDEIEVEWKQWVRDLPMNNDIFLVEEAFVKTHDEWKTWWSQNEHRLYFSTEENIYHVKDDYIEYLRPSMKIGVLKKM